MSKITEDATEKGIKSKDKLEVIIDDVIDFDFVTNFYVKHSFSPL